jgi:excisionase family DNA binding protein
MTVQRSSVVVSRCPSAERGRAHKTEAAPNSSRDAARPTASTPAGVSGRAREAIKFYTSLEVAECLNVSSRSVRRWIDAGLLVAHRFGGVVRIADYDLRAFLAEHRGG